MPVVTFQDRGESETLETESNATLLDALKRSRLKRPPPWYRRFALWFGGADADDVVVFVTAGQDRLTPPSAWETRRFTEKSDPRRLTSQAGLLPGADVTVHLQDPR